MEKVHAMRMKARIRMLSSVSALLSDESNSVNEYPQHECTIRRKRGRKASSPSSIKKDQHLRKEWEKARMNGTHKNDFCMRHNIPTIRAFDKILDRCRKRDTRGQ